MINLSLHKKLNSASGIMQLALDCQLEQGQMITLYGKSGAGKTSVLRMLAGLMQPDSGRIEDGSSVWYDSEKKVNLRPQKRKLGLVFQDYALFPNMTVRENLCFALEKQQEKSVVDELIDIMELEALQGRKPDTLSGGQKQRVALARALVQRPKLLLLDEPLSALDQEMRIKLQHYILKVHREFGLTTILVSHDLSEILRMSNYVLFLEEGRIIKQGTPSEVFDLQEQRDTLQLTGELIRIEKAQEDYLLTVLIGKDLLKINCPADKAEALQAGDKVLVSATSMQANIQKIQ